LAKSAVLVSRKLQIALDRLTPAVRREILRALTRLEQAADIAKITAAVERKDYWSLERLLASLPKDLARAGKDLSKAFEAGVKAGAEILPVSVVAKVRTADLLAAEAAKGSAAKLVTRVTTDTRKAIRALVAKSFEQGIDSRETAKQIRPLIGLTERQATAVLNARAKWARLGFKPDRIARESKRYTEKLLKQRATTIARTELSMASTSGQIAAWKDAKSQGLISDRMRMTWIVTPDDRLCPTCAPLEGHQAGLDGTFATAVGPVPGPPAHPNCRCAVGLAEVKQTSRRRAA
jgi:hypothetical protein